MTAATLVGAAAAALAGALFWTFMEYVLHRFVFHGPGGGGPGAREHRTHHAHVDYFAPWWQKGAAAVAVTAVLWPLASWAAGGAAGAAFTAGFVFAYGLYEWLHRRAHTHAPRGRYGRWLRRNHFAHHFVDPRRAHGVTTPLWDVVFGTRLPLGRLRVPRKMAMPWLVDGRGRLREAYARDYELTGAGS